MAPKVNLNLKRDQKTLNKNTILQDHRGNNWRIGELIKTGGFGEVYAACKADSYNYDYVIKLESHKNGTLFVEMHFYMRCLRLNHIAEYKQVKNLDFLGMPHMVANGSTEINGETYRFIVLPRYGDDLDTYIKVNGGRLPAQTAYGLAIQLIDIYEYIHSKNYTHGDLKALNILFDLKKDYKHVYLIDFGNVSPISERSFNPDKKKANNGTMKYISRDLHKGITSYRSDLEILGYNLIEWMGGKLPWDEDNQNRKTKLYAVGVEREKENFMNNLDSNLEKLFPGAVPDGILNYLKFVEKLEVREQPDYCYCRGIFQKSMDQINIPNKKVSLPPAKRSTSSPTIVFEMNSLHINAPIDMEQSNKTTVVQDYRGEKWRIGDLIRTEGFGKAYAACRTETCYNDHIIKLELHKNGSLFVEMHFYMRCLRLNHIAEYKKEKNLDFLGMPHMVANGATEINGEKYRFIVLPRYGDDLDTYIKVNGGRLPAQTAYGLAIQLIDTYEYIHSKNYTHGDLKALNILFDLKKDYQHVYLVNFGNVSKVCEQNLYPDKNKANNGTMSYMSRDLHKGITSYRSDLEILGYNLIEWMGGKLPWDEVNQNRNKELYPVGVEREKENFMNSLDSNLEKLFPGAVPDGILNYLKFIEKLEVREQPDYCYCRGIFQKSMDQINIPNKKVSLPPAKRATSSPTNASKKKTFA